MKNALKFPLIPWMTLALGGVGILGMLVLLHTGVDDRGLFLPWHWAGILVGAATAVMVVCLILILRPLGGTAKYSRMFPASKAAAAGMVAAAIGILVTAPESLFATEEPVRIISGVLKIVAGASLVYLGWCRFRGLRGSYLAWAAVTVFMMLRLMFEYRDWSSQPELLRYCFPLLSSVLLTLAFYYRTAFAINMGNRRAYLLCSQLGGFFAMLSLPGDFSPIYLGLAVWAVTDLCSLRPLKARPKQEER